MLVELAQDGIWGWVREFYAIVSMMHKDNPYPNIFIWEVNVPMDMATMNKVLGFPNIPMIIWGEAYGGGFAKKYFDRICFIGIPFKESKVWTFCRGLEVF